MTPGVTSGPNSVGMHQDECRGLDGSPASSKYGPGDSLFDAVRDSGADVFVTADLRHHPASELRDRAGEGPPYLVDVAHWASEWPWLAGVANRLEGAMDELGRPVEVHVSTRTTDPWTFRLPSPGGVVR